MLTKCKLLLKTKTENEKDTRARNPIAFSLCNEQFPTRFKFDKHLKRNADCNIQYQVGKFAHLNAQVPIVTNVAQKKRTFGNTFNTIATSPRKKIFFSIPESENAINRENAKQLGIPSEDIYISSWKIKYADGSKFGNVWSAIETAPNTTEDK